MTRQTSDTMTMTRLSDLEFEMTRIFDAPRQLVWDAHTRPEHVARWWGQKGSTLSVCEIDLRPGGAWRFVERAADGNDYGFRGIFKEIQPPERLVWTFEYEGMPGHISVETLTFEDIDGKTKLTAVSVFESAEDLDGMIQAGMEQGARESWDRLSDLLVELSVA